MVGTGWRTRGTREDAVSRGQYTLRDFLIAVYHGTEETNASRRKRKNNNRTRQRDKTWGGVGIVVFPKDQRLLPLMRRISIIAGI